jgi:MiaB-like tRNA modifying enzyme
MKKFYLETYGCKLNQSDSDLIRGILVKNFKEVSSSDEADFVVINSCGVVEKTERKIIKRIKSLHGKKIILAGCLSLINPTVVKEMVDGAIGPKNLLSIEKVAKGVLEGERIVKVSSEKINKAGYYHLKKRVPGGISAIVSIAEGCLGNCSFCVSKYARGRLESFAMKDILKEIESLVDSGYKEIQLTSQDAVIYGLDKGEFLLPELLNKITKIKGNFRVRVGMMNPAFVEKTCKELISAFRSEKIYKFLHIPLQSGDNKILKKMNRGYLTEDFIKVVNSFRKEFEDVLVATDVIVGYPGETEKSFKKTLEVIKEVRPSIIHIFRFSKRPFCDAEKLKDFPDRIKK